MFNLIKLIIGPTMFLIGVALPPNLFSLLLVMIGSFIISRPLALDSGFGNTPFLFLIGMLLFIPSFFLTNKICSYFGMDDGTGDILRITACLVTGVFSWLSICKK